MRVPDVIAILRALAVIPVVWLIAVDARAAALGVFLVAAASDAVDGWAARRTGATEHGALIDPLADKVLVVGTLVALAAAGRGWPVTVVAILVGARELVVAVARMRAYASRVSLPADAVAKAKTAGELIGTAMIIWADRPWAVLGAGLVGIAFVAGVAVLPRYLSTGSRSN